MLRHKPFGKRIRLLREMRCWTQQQLAQATGYSVKTIYKAEAGRLLKRQTLADIARALDVPIEDIARLPAASQKFVSFATNAPRNGQPQTFHKSSTNVPQSFLGELKARS